MFFDSWSELYRIFVVAICAYIGMIALLRISGNRTLSKMNSFDFIVTIALGSTLSSGILQKSVPLSDTLFATAVLIGLQYVVTWLSVRFSAIDRLIKSEPQLVFRQGQFLKGAMKKFRLTEDEVKSAIRKQGFYSPQVVESVVLETNGSLSATGKICESANTKS